MTDQHDARDETAELLAWFTEADGFNQGTKAPHKWVLRAEQELRRRAATQPAKPEQQAGGVPAGFVLVPVEPTRDMLMAGHWADDGGMMPTAIWNAMLAAAPSQSAVQPT